MDPFKHDGADDCSSSAVKNEYPQGRRKYAKDRYACEDCIRANQFCVRLYKRNVMDEWNLVILPLPPTEDPKLGLSMYNLTCWVKGNRAGVTEKATGIVPGSFSSSAQETSVDRERAPFGREADCASNSLLGSSPSGPQLTQLSQPTAGGSQVIDLDPDFALSDDNTDGNMEQNEDNII